MVAKANHTYFMRIALLWVVPFAVTGKSSAYALKAAKPVFSATQAYPQARKTRREIPKYLREDIGISVCFDTVFLSAHLPGLRADFFTEGLLPFGQLRQSRCSVS